MAPLVRRSWAPRGHTPLLFQRTQSHKKVSVIAVLCVSPKRDLVRLYFRLHPDVNINAPLVLDFLKNLIIQLKKSPMILIWDRFLAHRAKKVQSFFWNSKILHSEYLPAYAPELKPSYVSEKYSLSSHQEKEIFFFLLLIEVISRQAGR